MRMSTKDRIKLSRQNIARSKGRTILTVLGVVVGCCAINLTISLGVALSHNQQKMLSEMGDLTVIDVYNYGTVKDGKKLTLKDKEINTIANMDHVTGVTPIKNSMDNIEITIETKKNKSLVIDWVSYTGMKAELIKKFGYQLTSGEVNLHGSNSNKIYALAGSDFAYQFTNLRKRTNNMVEAEKDEAGNYINKPYVNIEKDKLYLVGKGTDSKGNEKTFKRELVIVGNLKEDMSRGYETIAGLILDIDQLSKFEKDAIRSMQLNRSKESKNKGYTQAKIKVDKIQNVADVNKKVQDMGYETSSMDEIREQMEGETRKQQKTLSGLGAISLLVAAMGITNTMLMSVNERKKDIGIMKVLGCELRDIVEMFLTEAGMIGFFGGAIGVTASYIISGIMNISANGGIAAIENVTASSLWQAAYQNPNPNSIIPLWLVGVSLVFSISIGIISGAYPAIKAVKISALEAMKN